MELMVYSIAQPILNLGLGFIWGVIFPSVPLQRPLALWGLLIVFVSVRVVGDWLFNQPHLPWESLRLYLYATCFFAGIMLARYLRVVYWPTE
jgi:hypothetical protein